MCLKIVDQRIRRCNIPNLECHVIGTGGQKGARRVPFDGVHFIRVSLKSVGRPRVAQLTDVDLLVGGTGGKRSVVLPVDIEGRRFMESKLLGTLTGRCVPNDGRFIDSRRQDVISFLVPLEGENWSEIIITIS